MSDRKRCSQCNLPETSGTLWLHEDALWCGSCLRTEAVRLDATVNRKDDQMAELQNEIERLSVALSANCQEKRSTKSPVIKRVLECKRCLLHFDVDGAGKLSVVWGRHIAIPDHWRVKRGELCPNCQPKKPALRDPIKDIETLVKALSVGYETNFPLIEGDGFTTVYPPLPKKTPEPAEEPTCHICGRDAKVCRATGEFCGWSL